MDRQITAQTQPGRPAAFAFCLACLVFCGLLAQAADWPTWRGNPQQTGVATSPLPAKLQVLWKFKAKDQVGAAAAIVGDTAYVASYDRHLYALKLDDGQPRWTFKAKGELRTAPAVRDGLVYVGDDEGHFYCLRAADGTQVWTMSVKGEILSSPNFYKDRVLFGATDSVLYCLDAKSGETRWKFQAKDAINCSIAIVENRAFLTGCDPVFHVIDMDKGKQIMGPELGIQGDQSAAVSGELLFVSNISKNQVVGVNWKKGETVWEYQDEDTPFPFHSSAAVADGLVLIGGRDKHLHAIEAATGKRKWAFEARGRIDSSPVVVGNRVFFGSTDGNLYEVDLKKGERISSWPLGAPVNAAPAVGQNRLIVGTNDGTVYCFGAK